MVLMWVSGSRELGHAPITWERQFDLRALPAPCSQPWRSAACGLCAEYAHPFVSTNYFLRKQFCYCLTLQLGKQAQRS